MIHEVITLQNNTDVTLTTFPVETAARNLYSKHADKKFLIYTGDTTAPTNDVA